MNEKPTKYNQEDAKSENTISENDADNVSEN
jgi:hypothetical protein